jgi:hypothetical protein
MSWPGHAAGLVIWAVNVLGFLATAGQIDSLRIRDMTVDLKTGTIATLGGWVSNLKDNPAYSIGAFAWFNTSDKNGTEIDTISQDVLEHEAGHVLNNAAFGWFQTYNIIDPHDHDDKFFERLAESHAPPSRGHRRDDLNQWGA